MSVIIGFTGTQRGMTEPQKRRVRTLLREATEAWHGDCIGGDAEFGEIAEEYGILEVAWPGHDIWGRSPKRAHRRAQLVMTPRPYMERNHIIASEVDILIACPGEMEEKLRSGTWATVRHARKLETYTHLILPDGSLGC